MVITKNPGENEPFNHSWRSASFGGDVIRYPLETSREATEPTVQDRFDSLGRQNKQNYQFDNENKKEKERERVSASQREKKNKKVKHKKIVEIHIQ